MLPSRRDSYERLFHDAGVPRCLLDLAPPVLPEQFDAHVWFDEIEAVTSLGPEHHRGMPETYPFGE